MSRQANNTLVALAALIMITVTGCASPDGYRLETIQAKLLHSYDSSLDEKSTEKDLFIIERYGITDPALQTIDDVEKKLSSKGWDSSTKDDGRLILRKTVVRDGKTLDYRIIISRPTYCDPWELEAMDADDQGEFISIEYTISEMAEEPEGQAGGLISTNDVNGDPMLIDNMTKEYLESEKPNPSQKSLDEMLSQIDRIRVIHSGMDGSDLVILSTNQAENPQCLLDTTDVKQIAAFRDCLKIYEETGAFGHCMCLGWPTLEFLKGTQLVARIGLHHGQSIRWSQWKYDTFLKHNQDVLGWLSTNGVPQPKQDYEADQASQKESEKQYESWLTSAPTSILSEVKSLDWGMGSVSKEDTDALYKKLTAKVAPEEQALYLLEWYGSGCGFWSGYSSYENLPKDLLLNIPTPTILAAMTNELSKAQLEGASRFFCSSEFNRQRYKDRKLIPEGIKKAVRQHVEAQKDEFKTRSIEYWFPK